MSRQRAQPGQGQEAELEEEGGQRLQECGEEGAGGAGMEAEGQGFGDHGRPWAFTWSELGALGGQGRSPCDLCCQRLPLAEG